MFKMYCKEWPGFMSALKREGQGLDNMWRRLDDINVYNRFAIIRTP